MKKLLISLIVLVGIVGWALLLCKDKLPVKSANQIAYLDDLDNLNEKDPLFFKYLATNTAPVVYKTITTTNRVYQLNVITNIVVQRNIDTRGWTTFVDSNSSNSKNIEGELFGSLISTYRTGTKHVIVGSNVTSIESQAFRLFASMTSIEIPASVTSIKGYAFQHSGLESIILPDTVTFLGSGAFYQSALVTATLGRGIREIPACLFQYCNNLVSVTIPNTVTSIERLSFSSCPNLKFLSIPESVESIGANIFQSSGTTTITIPDSATNISSAMLVGSVVEKIYVPTEAKKEWLTTNLTNGASYEIIVGEPEQ